ncbi:MAG: hypothetical protein K1X88_23930 [Nannocystaceae bacterium]|nr:hypothetical protein [Nannocystaceae bacterium]
MPAAKTPAPTPSVASPGAAPSSATPPVATAPATPPVATPPVATPPVAADTSEPAAVAPAGIAAAAATIPVVPWAPVARAVEWTPQPAPPAVVQFEPQVEVGLIGRAGPQWLALGATGALEPVQFDREPQGALQGRWPDDVWVVERREREYDEFPVHELRLMKLRGGDRWVPQERNGEQWWHPGTEDEDEPHISTYTGMLVYPASLERIDRIAGRTESPLLFKVRGKAVDFVETHKGKLYVLSADDAGVYVQSECWDDACVAAMSKQLPGANWRFGARVARGKFSVSVVASSGEESYMLNNIGKHGDWRLETLPRGETLAGMWASDDGSLWTLAGSALRWRDTEGTWHEVAPPAGFEIRAVAMSGDRGSVWLSGEQGGGPALVSAGANEPKP